MATECLTAGYEPAWCPLKQRNQTSRSEHAMGFNAPLSRVPQLFLAQQMPPRKASQRGTWDGHALRKNAALGTEFSALQWRLKGCTAHSAQGEKKYFFHRFLSRDANMPDAIIKQGPPVRSTLRCPTQHVISQCGDTAVAGPGCSRCCLCRVSKGGTPKISG